MSAPQAVLMDDEATAATREPCPVAPPRDVPSDLYEFHTSLSRELHEKRRVIIEDRVCRKDFIRRFDQLARRLRQFAANLASTEALEWLSKITAEWQMAFSSTLREPRDLRKDIGISVPSRDLEYLSWVTEADVHRYLEAKAYEIGQDRKLNRLYRQWIEMKNHRNWIHDTIRSTREESDKDWYLATVCFATEVLDGRVSFTREIPRELYPQLESVWLEDVKRMKAYLIWEKSNAPFHPDGGKGDYLLACDQMRQRAMDAQFKANASSASFAEVRTYLEEMYLSDGRVDSVGDCSAHDLIARKAHRLWELQGRQSNAAADWDVADR